MGEIYEHDANVLEDDSLDRSKELSLVMSYLEEALFEEFYGDIMMGSDTLSIKHIEPICISSLLLSIYFPSPLVVIMHFMSLQMTLEVIIPLLNLM